MDVLEAVWVAAILVVMLVGIVAVAVVGGHAITAGFRQVESGSTTG